MGGSWMDGVTWCTDNLQENTQKSHQEKYHPKGLPIVPSLAIAPSNEEDGEIIRFHLVEAAWSDGEKVVVDMKRVGRCDEEEAICRARPLLVLGG